MDGLDAIVINASGCGTTVKDYGFMLREDEQYAALGRRRFAGMTKDITEFMSELGLAARRDRNCRSDRVAYHSACSLQHGQKVATAPKAAFDRRPALP